MIELQDICKTYAQGNLYVRALDHVHLGIQRGEYVAVLGPSGSGKSTLLNVLGLLDQPSHGQYRINGQDLHRDSDTAMSALRNAQIGFVFQSFHLLPRLTLLENVLLPLRYARAAVPNARERAQQLLARVGLAERAQHRPAELSGGQMQRAAIARALLLKPPLLLADEPTGNLDSKSANDVLELFDELHAEGQTIVLVTHDAEVAARTQRRIWLRDGRVERDEVQA
jgi:putative ABC transport system ATP-binding protein